MLIDGYPPQVVGLFSSTLSFSSSIAIHQSHSLHLWFSIWLCLKTFSLFWLFVSSGRAFHSSPTPESKAVQSGDPSSLVSSSGSMDLIIVLVCCVICLFLRCCCPALSCQCLLICYTTMICLDFSASPRVSSSVIFFHRYFPWGLLAFQHFLLGLS